MTNRFLTFIDNAVRLVTAIPSSAGIADAFNIIATNASGRIDQSFLPNLRAIALTDAATVTPNSNTTDIGTLATLSQNTTFANPTGTPSEGQLLQLRITSLLPRLLTFGSGYQVVSIATTSGGGVSDYIALRWNATSSIWDIVSNTFQISFPPPPIDPSFYPEPPVFTMTTDSSPNPFVARASSFFAAEEAFRAFDNTDSIWTSTASGFPQWLSIDYGQIISANRYTLTNRDSFIGRMPFDFKLQRSADNVSWQDVDTRSAQAFTASESRTYSFPLSASKHWRLLVQAANGESLTHVRQMTLSRV